MTDPPHRAANGYYYLPDDNEVGRPSVTSILSSIDKPFLVDAAARMTARYAVDHVDEPTSQIAGWYRDEWTQKADLGTRVHDWAAAYALGNDCPDIERADKGYIAQVQRFFDEWQIGPLYVEFECCSRTHDYAGSGDLIARLGPDGPVALIDYKTGAPARDTILRPEIVGQLNAYAHAEYLCDGDTLVDMPHIDCAFGVSLQPRSYKVVPVTLSGEAFRRFLYLRHGSFDYAAYATPLIGAPADPATFVGAAT